MSSLRSTPKPSSPALDRHGVLQFRHPWVADPDGYGQVVRRSFAKLNPAERGLLLMSAQNLLGTAPLHRHDTPTGLDPRLLDAYFKPLEALQQQQEFLVQVHADGTLHVQGVPSTQDALINDPVQAGKYAARIKQLEDQHASMLEETQRLRKQVEEYERIIARKERELNEHVTVTLEQAFTPTSVGKTPPRAGGRAPRPVHPHERGEDTPY